MPTLPTVVLPRRIPHGPLKPATAIQVSPLLLEAAGSEPEEVLRKLHTSKDGLSGAEAERPPPHPLPFGSFPFLDLSAAELLSCVPANAGGERDRVAVRQVAATGSVEKRGHLFRALDFTNRRDLVTASQEPVRCSAFLLKRSAPRARQ